jgi:hypothetical protein
MRFKNKLGMSYGKYDYKQKTRRNEIRICEGEIPVVGRCDCGNDEWHFSIDNKWTKCTKCKREYQSDISSGFQFDM